ncbi:MAG: ATP-binding cassette domain-containing protein, partial [Clostridia bacterium]|nr:ATP-binding cassette domain-containing protein [Clostridia bacterium]
CIKKDVSENLFSIKNLSLKIKRGEILGIAGVEGNGQKELAESIMGLLKVDSGKILINGKEIQNLTPSEVLKHKVSIIHEDRHKRGLVLDFSVAENAVLEKYKENPFSLNGILNYKAINSFTKNLIKDYSISPERCHKRRIRKLSGGNQQKLIIGREVSSDPDLLIAVQPTRGLDVGAIEYVHKTLIKEREKGRAILLISLELDELLALSSRIAVIYNGEILGSFNREEANEENIGFLMTGGNENTE